MIGPRKKKKVHGESAQCDRDVRWVLMEYREYPIYLVFDLDMIHLTTIDRKVPLFILTGVLDEMEHCKVVAPRGDTSGQHRRTSPHDVHVPTNQPATDVGGHEGPCQLTIKATGFDFVQELLARAVRRTATKSHQRDCVAMQVLACKASTR